MNKEKLLEQLREMKTHCEKIHQDCENCSISDVCTMPLFREAPVRWKLANNKRWRAKMGEEYWYVNSLGDIPVKYDFYRKKDDYLYNSHNYFKTEEEARKYARVLETEMLLKKFADEHNYKPIDWKDTNEPKCFLLVDYDTPEMVIYSTFYNCEPRIVHFNSKEIAQEAVNEIGKDRIIDYLTYEW